MFSLNFLKKSGPDVQPNRCHFQHQNGRRCRLPVAGESTEFCGTHRDMRAEAKTKAERDSEAAAIYAEVTGPIKSLDSAVAINHVLGNLFRLTLKGRIPQRKAATLTTQLRVALRTVEAARSEITTAKLFPRNHRPLLALLTLLDEENAESETVAPNSSSAISRVQEPIAQPESGPAVVAAGLARPGSGQNRDIENRLESADADERETVAPLSTAAVFATSGSISDSEPAPTSENAAEVVGTQLACPEPTRRAVPAPCRTTTASTVPNPPTQPSHSSDGVCWIGPKPDQIDWARVEKEKQEYERYLRRAYPPTLNGYHHIPPDKIPLWWKLRKPR